MILFLLVSILGKIGQVTSDKLPPPGDFHYLLSSFKINGSCIARYNWIDTYLSDNLVSCKKVVGICNMSDVINFKVVLKNCT